MNVLYIYFNFVFFIFFLFSRGFYASIFRCAIPRAGLPGHHPGYAWTVSFFFSFSFFFFLFLSFSFFFFLFLSFSFFFFLFLSFSVLFLFFFFSFSSRWVTRPSS